jgi:hypothetical protein
MHVFVTFYLLGCVSKRKGEITAILKGSKFQHSINDEEFFRPNGRYRITIRDLSKEELHEIVSAVTALNLVSK